MQTKAEKEPGVTGRNRDTTTWEKRTTLGQWQQEPDDGYGTVHEEVDLEEETPLKREVRKYREMLAQTPLMQDAIACKKMIDESPLVQEAKELQRMIDESPLVQEAKELQRMIDESPLVQEAKELQRMIDESPLVQEAKELQRMIDESPLVQEARRENLARLLGHNEDETISQPQDALEIEADRKADEVVAARESDLTLRDIQHDTASLQRKTMQDETPLPEIKITKDNLAGGSPLKDAEKTYFEPRFGADFSGVRIHTDAQSAELARALQAKAFTKGSNIVFAKGEYDTGSTEGKKLMAHELAHVVQQGEKDVASAKKIQRQHMPSFHPLARIEQGWRNFVQKIGFGKNYQTYGPPYGSSTRFKIMKILATELTAMGLVGRVGMGINPYTHEKLKMSERLQEAGVAIVTLGGAKLLKAGSKLYKIKAAEKMAEKSDELVDTINNVLEAIDYGLKSGMLKVGEKGIEYQDTTRNLYRGFKENFLNENDRNDRNDKK